MANNKYYREARNAAKDESLIILDFLTYLATTNPNRFNIMQVRSRALEALSAAKRMNNFCLIMDTMYSHSESINDALVKVIQLTTGTET